MDTETEKEIQKALDNLVQGRTTIAIAHRLSTLRKADRLVVLDRGQVVEVGPHDELMAQQGAYWRLYEAQARQVDSRRSGARSAAALAIAAQVAAVASTHAAVHGEVPSMSFELQRNAFGRLVLTGEDGVAHDGVVPVRAFPISAPEEGISLVSTEGHELAWIERLDDLPPAQRALIDEELAEREFVPEITRICRRRSFAHAQHLAGGDRPRRDPLRAQGRGGHPPCRPSMLLIADSHGLQFVVRDMTALDRDSRRLLERFL